MATVALTNIGPRKFIHPLFGYQPADGVTRTYTLNINQSDNTAGNYDSVAKFGVIVSESGTPRPGSVVVTTTASITATQQAVLIDAVSSNYVITLPLLSSVPVGHAIHFYLRSNTSATVTIDGNGAETVLGAANQTLSTVGSFLRLMKENSTNWKAYSL
jgi:hypothetical protein